MRSTAAASSSGFLSRYPRLMLAAMLVIGVAFTGWVVQRADEEMREDLLSRARLIAKAVDLERLESLSGTEADLDTPSYLLIKKRLASGVSADRRCRFIYLMGRRPDGRVFFFVDSEPVGSGDESPAGQIYEEISPGYLEAFETGRERAEGPVTDRWGTWVTALIPRNDPESGELRAVLGMDVEVSDWYWTVAARVALPVGLMLALLILLAAGIVAVRSGADASARPVRHRLLVPLGAAMLILVGGSVGLLSRMQQNAVGERSRHTLEDARNELDESLAEQSEMLGAMETLLLHDSVLRVMLEKGDRRPLLACYESIFEQLRSEHAITHFYFHDRDRVNLLRVHQPERYGDRIDRFTAREAERTGRVSWGIELGPLGTFTLRSVQPIFDGGELLGYLELGKEIEDILEAIHEEHGVETVVSIRKNLLDRESWEQGMEWLGRESRWDQFEGEVLTYSSRPEVSDHLTPFLEGAEHHQHGVLSSELSVEGRTWQVAMELLFDASGSGVGDLCLLQDVTDARAAFHRALGVMLSGSLILLATLLATLHVLLLRTDRGLLLQKKALIESEQRFDLAMSVADDGVWDWDLQTGRVFFDSRCYAMIGHEPDGFPSTFEEWGRRIHPDEAERPRRAIERCIAGRVATSEVEFRMRREDGTYVWIRSKGRVVEWDGDGNPTRYVGTNSDISEQRRLTAELTRIKHAVDSSGDAIGIATVDGHHLYQNATFTRLFGYEAEDFEEVHSSILYADQELARDVFDTLASGGKRAVELEMIAKDGRRFPVQLRADAVKDEHGETICTIGVHTDISDRRQTEEHLEKALEESTRLVRLMSGREMRVVEMKREVNALLEEQGQGLKYESVE
jgi:PAS domain S-box-containing protein